MTEDGATNIGCARLRGVVAGLALALLSGCATQQMKGTPFYTGEYGPSRGPAEDRVNLWPLVYYRSPALSVLWPIGEWTDGHWAVRPLMSVYREDGGRCYSVLWPLSQYSSASRAGWVFPVSWGPGRCSVFPLYWHHGSAATSAGRRDLLIPLWSFYRSRDGYSHHVLWPVFNARSLAGEQGWRVWPVAGRYASEGGHAYSFYLWPLGHVWREGGRTRGHALVPLYGYERNPRGANFFSLPYSTHRGVDGSRWDLVPPLVYRRSDAGGSKLLTPLYCRGRRDGGATNAWSLLVPLYYQRRTGAERWVVTPAGGWHRDGDRTDWAALPLLSWGSREPGASSTWALGPLAHASQDGGDRASHVFPFYYASRRDGETLFVSLPWSAGNDGAGTRWQMAPPFFWRRRAAEQGSTLVTPLYARGSNPAAQRRWQALFPLFYQSRAGRERTLATLLGGVRSDADGRRWLVYPLLSGGRRGPDGGEIWLAAPLFHARWDRQSCAHHLLPLYYWDPGRSLFASPLAARWKSGERRTTLVPPLLTLKTSQPGRSDLWTAGGLVRAGWGTNAGPSHVLPLFYRDPRTGTLVTPLAATWRRADGSRRALVPPALSWWTVSASRGDLWALGPLAHVSWGAERGASHVFPLYYRNARRGTTVSPLYARWRRGDTRYTAIPPLLSGGASDGTTNHIVAALGLFHRQWSGDGNPSGGHLLPVYYHRGRDVVYTPLVGWKRDRDRGFVYPLTPLVGVRTGRYSGGWVFPLISRRAERGTRNVRWTFLWGHRTREAGTVRSAFFPLYTYRRTPPRPADPRQAGTWGRRFWCLPICWYRNETTVYPAWWRGEEDGGQPTEDGGPGAGRPMAASSMRRHGCFPLWSYRRDAGDRPASTNVGASVLLRLYDYRRDTRAPQGEAQPPSDYRRARVLWRLYHYERLNGDVSVDVFPAITYDRKANGYKKVSFLWRAFRYERKGGDRKLDLLFIPVMRRHAAAGPPADAGTGGAGEQPEGGAI